MCIYLFVTTSLNCFRYEEININLVDKPEWYLKKNAPGQVPGLEWIDRDSKETRFIPESLIVSDFLEEKHPEIRLQPTDAYLKAQQRVLVDRFSNVRIKNFLFQYKIFYLFQVTSAYYKIIRGDAQKGMEDLKKNLAVYEEALKDTYFGGSKPGMTDYMIWPWFERLPLLIEFGYEFNDDGKLPKLAAWVKEMEGNENVQKIKNPDELSKKFFEGYRQGKVEYDFE
jgi:glutathione S-transferase